MIGIVIYLLFSYLGDFLYEVLTRDLPMYVSLPATPLVAFTIKNALIKTNQHLEIHQVDGKKSPLRVIFTSDDKFLKYRDEVLDRIFSKEILISFLLISLLASACIIYDIFITHGFCKPYHVENAGIYGVLISLVYCYAFYWILGIAGFGVAWVLYCIIDSIIKIEHTEDLRIKESIKTVKALTMGEENE